MSHLCPHFGDCGGCATQDRPYDQQVAEKEERVRAMVAPFGPKSFLPIVPSPDAFFYRNKMEFVFGGLKDAPPLLGLRRRGKFDRVVDLSECRLLSPDAGALLGAVRGWAAYEKVPTYHLKSHRGVLRYLVVREGKNTGQRMVCLITAEGEWPRESFIRAVRDSGVRVDTLVWLVNAGLSDVAWGEQREIFWGPGWIEEKLGDKTFRISPRTFFQTNTRAAEGLYSEIKKGLVEGWISPSGKGRREGMVGPDNICLLDFYCGAGTIGLFCADQDCHLIGIEINESAVADARANADRMGSVGTEFYAMDAAVFSRSEKLMEAWRSPTATAVFDPPRPGLAPEVRRLLTEHPIARWAYVSCNPDALARDLALLSSVYQVVSVRPFDLFPHTPHVETLVWLERGGGSAISFPESAEGVER